MNLTDPGRTLNQIKALLQATPGKPLGVTFDPNLLFSSDSKVWSHEGATRCVERSASQKMRFHEKLPMTREASATEADSHTCHCCL